MPMPAPVTRQGCDLLCLDLPRAEAVRAALPDVAGSRVMAFTAKALADPVRLRVATALALGQELCLRTTITPAARLGAVLETGAYVLAAAAVTGGLVGRTRRAGRRSRSS